MKKIITFSLYLLLSLVIIYFLYEKSYAAVNIEDKYGDVLDLNSDDRRKIALDNILRLRSEQNLPDLNTLNNPNLSPYFYNSPFLDQLNSISSIDIIVKNDVILKGDPFDIDILTQINGNFLTNQSDIEINLKIFKVSSDGSISNNSLIDVSRKFEPIQNVSNITSGKIITSSLTFANNFIPNSGNYIINASLSITQNDQTFPESAIKKIHSTGLFDSTAFMFLYISIIILVIFLGILVLSNFSIYLMEIIKFISITGILVSLVFFLVLIDFEIGQTSPIGIIKNIPQNNFPDQSNFININEEWVLNLGGTEVSTDLGEIIRGGIQIPLYVIILGFAGGYLRYLYNTYKKDASDMIEKETSQRKYYIFRESIGDLTVLFLAPLLAVSLWLLLSLTGITHTFTFALASLSVGLITNEIIERIISFVKSNISNNKASEQ